MLKIARLYNMDGAKAYMMNRKYLREVVGISMILLLAVIICIQSKQITGLETATMVCGMSNECNWINPPGHGGPTRDWTTARDAALNDCREKQNENSHDCKIVYDKFKKSCDGRIGCHTEPSSFNDGDKGGECSIASCDCKGKGCQGAPPTGFYDCHYYYANGKWKSDCQKVNRRDVSAKEIGYMCEARDGRYYFKMECKLGSRK